MSTPVIDSQTATELVFTVTLPATASVLDIVLLDAAGVEGGRGVDAIQVVIPTITSVSPNPGMPGTNVTYTLTGTNLLLVDHAGARISTSTGGWTDMAISAKTDTSFTFSGNWGDNTLLDIACLAADDRVLAEKADALRVLNTTPRIDTVTPTSIYHGSASQIVVTGYGLLQVSTWRIGTSGVGFDDSNSSDYIGTPTDTRIEFWTIPDLCGPGLHDLIGNKSGGTAYIRKDDSITVT